MNVRGGNKCRSRGRVQNIKVDHKLEYSDQGSIPSGVYSTAALGKKLSAWNFLLINGI